MSDKTLPFLVRRVWAAEDGDDGPVLDRNALAKVAGLRRRSLQDHGHPRRMSY
ncbi:hypothetical protein ACFFX1_34075 [Dactylosporangium sucinum]|uniref:Uncharacterized protein n=1 Tax=Dactylosporangium sucinum TaxID=1424081 RepID=A0A917UFK7_9ACTN|nr:hypothetical protein [Dactylosporangium sucinum]GGM88792.1 hypothetical protein GCM10007977_108490 [Dactylosporangium sucinum]